ncbi:hypothetical protein NL676_002859 [Syzygium grande]|nr:hypothetical protein NL676_002859 [Syzygium grande]
MASLRSLPSFFLSFSFVFLSHFSNFTDTRQAQVYVYPTATLSTRWTNNATASHSARCGDGSIMQAILLGGKGDFGLEYACGFYCNGNCNAYLFAVFIVRVNSSSLIAEPDNTYPQVVWSANRNNLVQLGATLELTSKGDLVLKDADGTVAWFTNTSGKSVLGLNLTDFGNLVLFDKNNATVWQSFDEPTDSLVLGQKLRQGQRLMPSVSETNWTVDGTISLSVNGNGLSAQLETNPPQLYFIPQASSAQYMKLGSDGHLRVYEFGWEFYSWKEVADLFPIEDCSYPTACGRYGICSNGQCSCPASSYFQQIDDRQPNLGSKRLPVILGSGLGTLLAIMIFIVAILLSVHKIVFFVQKREHNQAEEDYLDQVLGMPNRFTYDDLRAITDEFSKKLGDGGFGSVFEGTLGDGTKVAVKRLDGFGQVKKSFLAEVETIGNIHHVNLVRLVGFCAEKSHRLLIYEYMLNGSLDRWIFHKSNEYVLDWQQRKKIILDIAKGLNYLHEGCRQKIVHLDIKPQNILLDGNFNAKVADFGLSKLIERDQSQVVTTMRGTPGYLAPEWLSAAITEKVDVYSFGMVILEIVCGRKLFNRFLDEEDMYLLSLFKRKAEEERLLDIVDKSSDDMQLNGLQAMNMMRIAAWCLQGDYMKRPSMSMVIKVLEGITEVREDLDYDFSTQPSTSGAARFDRMDVELSATTALLPSILSGPR